jgi:hypothetical protein
MELNAFLIVIFLACFVPISAQQTASSTEDLHKRVVEMEHGVLVGLLKGKISATPYAEIVAKCKPLDKELLELARSVNVKKRNDESKNKRC